MRRAFPILAVALSVIGCEQDAAPTTTSSAGLTSAQVDSVPAPDAGAQPVESAAPPVAGCGGLVGVQQITLLPTEDGNAKTFRFGTDEGALIYETEWTGDLNDDGVEDRIARRHTDGSKSVRIVLVGCGDEFALAWAGVANSIAVAPETTTHEERSWNKLGIDSGQGIKTHEFNGTKYAVP